MSRSIDMPFQPRMKLDTAVRVLMRRRDHLVERVQQRERPFPFDRDAHEAEAIATVLEWAGVRVERTYSFYAAASAR